MAVYTISDLHLSLGADKPMEVFGPVWENYVGRLRENWQRTVKADDTVIVPGDISWATYLEHAKEDFQFIEELNGRKIILKGNHDYWWSTMSKLNQFLAEHHFRSIAFLHNSAVVCENIAVCGTRGWTIPNPSAAPEECRIFEREKIRLVLSLEEARKKKTEEIVVALHYPPVERGNPDTSMLDIMRQYGVKKCIYGHLHAASQRNAPIGDFDGIFLRLVACDYTDFTPILL